MEPCKHFDFDEWSTLAQKDPGRFEARRRAVIDAFIDGQAADRRQRLRRLQWRIDRERERSRSPLAACMRLSNLMWDRFAGEGGLVAVLNGVARDPRPTAPRRTARVLAFRPRYPRP